MRGSVVELERVESTKRRLAEPQSLDLQKSRQNQLNPVTKVLKVIMSAKNASEMALLPELFPLIADVLVSLNARKTLMKLLCTSHQIHALCLSSLMRSIELSFDAGFTGSKFAAFTKDSQGIGKFSFVRSLDWTRSLFGTRTNWLRLYPAWGTSRNGYAKRSGMRVRFRSYVRCGSDSSRIVRSFDERLFRAAAAF